jgi:hypothetical protein
VSGAIDGDTVTLNNPAAGTYADKHVGTAKNVSVTGILIASASNGAAAVYGYQLASTGANADVGEVTPATLVGTITAADKVYDATTAATIDTRMVTGVLGSDVVSYAGGTATFDTKNVGAGKTVTGAGLTLAGVDAGNYTVNGTAVTAAEITPRRSRAGDRRQHRAGTHVSRRARRRRGHGDAERDSRRARFRS